MNMCSLAFDAASVRRVDANGFLHVASSHITKATVNPYYGREIPGWQEAGLDPERIYYGFRAPEELRRSLPTWEGLPLHIEHHIDSADEPRKLTRVGAVGKAVWNAPYVDAPLTVWDRAVIDAIEDDSFRELSCAYRYDPDFTPGQYEGVAYDFIMRNIRGNHVALVEEGRAGPDVVVADAALWGEDAAFEESKHPRDKDGKFGKGEGAGGNAASEKEISLTGNELGSYRDMKELRQKAVDYYKTHLQGKPAHRDDIGEIRFSRKGMSEAKNFSADENKLLMFPALRGIIETGERGKEEKPNHPRKDGIVAFIPITKTVNIKGTPQDVEVLLGKDAQGNVYYDLFLNNQRQQKSLARNQVQNPGLARDTAGKPAVALNIVIKPVRVNPQTGVDAGRQPKHVAVMADAALWGEDAAFEESKHPRDKDGKFGKGEGAGGNAASGKEISLTGNELGSYRDIKELRQKAVDYYKTHLQGKPAHRDDIGEIRFSKKGLDETLSYSADPDKLFVIPALRDIIETGKLGKEEKLNHPRKDGIVAFIPVTKTVSLKGEKQEVEVLLGKDARGNLYYDIFLNNARQKKFPRQGVEQNPRLTGDTSGMQPAVALNIVIKPVRVNLQTGVDGSRQPNLIKGAVMRVKNWFRGARDADPGIERQEVDLAQAIIDLHKVDPETGEIVDITEDEDKAAEIRKLIGELSSRLDPAEVKRLTDALSDLAYSKATGDAEPDNRSFAEGVNYGERLERNPVERRKLDREHESEGMKRAMDACGLDADDEDASKAFAEGVKYGEGLLRNPAEREKLDREHESEGMKRAMDACGLDAENPQESRAFAEGVKYGEKLEKKEPEKLDREHESEGMKRALGKDEDKNAAIERILAGVPGLTPEQEAKLRSSLADLAYSPATGDADPDADPSAAQDRALRKPSGPRPLLASDAALIQARAVAAAQDNMRAIARAVADVRPLVGELDLLAFDSAANVYGYALEQSGVDARLYPRDAWRGMVDVLRRQKSPSGRRLAQDAAPRKLDGQFAGLNTISIGD